MLPDTLTPELREMVKALPPSRRARLMELRLRSGGQVRGVFPWGEELLSYRGAGYPVTPELLKTLLDRATGFSPYALRMEESGLFLPLEHGCRMGLCGEAVVRNGALMGLRQVTSMVIRFARACPGVAAEVAKTLLRDRPVASALILSPPGMGKTTFLRDLIRQLSESGLRVGVCDERRELGAVSGGNMTLDLGPCTDVLSGCPKSEALSLMLRVMNPQVVAVDELSGREELQVARETVGCGVALLATAHARSLEELRHRPGFSELLEERVFSYVITMEAGFHARIERLEAYDQDHGCAAGGGGSPDERLAKQARYGTTALSVPSASSGTGADAGGDGDKNASGGRAL